MSGVVAKGRSERPEDMSRTFLPSRVRVRVTATRAGDMAKAHERKDCGNAAGAAGGTNSSVSKNSDRTRHLFRTPG